MKTNSVLKITGVFLGIVLSFVLIILLINNFDEPLRPEVAAVIEKKLTLSEKQKVAYEKMKSNQKLCHQMIFSPEIESFFDELLMAEQFLVPENDSKIQSCLYRMSINELSERYLERIDKQHEKKPAVARERLFKYLNYMLRTSSQPQSILNGLISNIAASNALALAKKWSIKDKAVAETLRGLSLESLTGASADETLTRLRDAELKASYELFFAQMIKSNTFNKLFEVSSLEESLQSASIRDRIESRILYALYLPNKTLNKMYDVWNEEIKNVKRCLETNCQVEAKPRSLSPAEMLVNFTGNSTVKILTGNLYSPLVKFERQKPKLQSEFQALTN